MSSPPPASRSARPARLLPVGRFFGVPLYFAPSWVLIAVVITITYHGLITDQVDGVSESTGYPVAFGFAIALALCVLGHELGHVAVGLALRRKVRHVVIFLLGGVTEFDEQIDRPRDEFLIALAGPFVSLLLGGVSALGYYAATPQTLPAVFWLLLLWSNLIVAVFNLLPGLPLDGGLVLRATVWGLGRSRLAGTRAAAWAGRGIAVLVVLPGLLLRSASWSLLTALVGVALGAFIWIGATQSLRQVEVQERLPALELTKLIRPGLFVPADVSVAEALRRTWATNSRAVVVVDSAHRPQALVDEGRISAVPMAQRPWVSVTEVARPIERGMVLPLAMSGSALLDAVRETPAAEYLIVHDDGTPAGILAASDLATAVAGHRR